MRLKETYNKLKLVIEGIKNEEVLMPFETDNLDVILNELKDDVEEAYEDVSYWKTEYNNLEDDWMVDHLENEETTDIIRELKKRRIAEENVICADNPRDEMKVEILQDIFNKYNLEQLQELNERFITRT